MYCFGEGDKNGGGGEVGACAERRLSTFGGLDRHVVAPDVVEVPLLLLVNLGLQLPRVKHETGHHFREAIMKGRNG